MVSLISLKDLAFSYDEKAIFTNLSWEVQAGEFWGILGANGCGKTTLLKLLAALLKPSQGEIFFKGKGLAKYSPKELACHLALLAQENEFSFSYSVFDLVLMGRAPFLGFLQISGEEDFAFVEKVMKETDIWDLRKQGVRTLSGGEKERVLLARALVQSPELLLLDEPTTYMDIRHQYESFRLFNELNQEKGLTVVAVLHDLNFAYQICQKVVLLKDGAIFAMGDREAVMTAENLESVFGVPVKCQEGQGQRIFLSLPS